MRITTFTLLAAVILSAAGPGAVDGTGTVEGPPVGTAPADADPIRHVDGSVSALDVVPAAHPELGGVHDLEPGETAVVRGETNLNPDFNDVFVTLERNGTVIGRPGTAERWGTDGVWRTTVRVPPDAAPGRYTVVADAGVAVAFARVTVVGEGEHRAAVEAEDQPVGEPAVLVVGAATLPHGGYILVRNETTTLGVSGYLLPGSHRDVGIGLSREFDRAAVLTVELRHGNVTGPSAPYRTESGVVDDTATVRPLGRYAEERASSRRSVPPSLRRVRNSSFVRSHRASVHTGATLRSNTTR